MPETPQKSLIARVRDWLVGEQKALDTIGAGAVLDPIHRMMSPDMADSERLQQYRKSLYVFACISKIAQKVAATEFKMFKVKNSRGDQTEVVTHPALDLLSKFNPFQTKTEFLEITVINLKTTGDAFWYKARNNGGQVMELWNIRPDVMTIVTDPQKWIKEYVMQKADGTQEHFPPEDIIHFRKPDPMDNYLGMSPIRPAATRIQTEMFASRYQRDFFLNSARPDGVIKNPKSFLDADQKDDIRAGFEKLHRGLGRSSKVAILDAGLEYQQISLSQREMDFIESMKATRDDILVAFQVPKVILSIVEDVNRANAETGMSIFLSETIKPEVEALVEKINEELIYPEFGPEYYLDFEDMVPANRDQELLEYSNGITNRWLLINEIRSKEGLPPIKGGWSIYGQISEVPLGGLPQAEQKALAKAILSQDTENERIITEAKQINKKYTFKGRFWFKTKLQIREEVIKKLSKTKGDKVSFMKDEDVRLNYYTMINKALDIKTDTLEKDMVEFAKEQEARVLAALDGSQKANTPKVSVSTVFDEKAETKATFDFLFPYLSKYLTDAAREALNTVAPQEDFQDSPHIQAAIKARAKQSSGEITGTTRDKIAEELAAAHEAGEGIRDMATRIQSVFAEFNDYRAERVARTESTSATNQGFLEGYRQSGVANGKEWIATLDGRTRDSHAAQDGEIIGLEESFSDGLMFPGDPAGDPGETINCRCVLAPAFIE